MLVIEHLSKTYDNDVKALDDVNIEAGMFGLLGPNGAGKIRISATSRWPSCCS